eukprot:scaffold29782_cov53-Cyclotella_meneghiniana.AAC.3
MAPDKTKARCNPTPGLAVSGTPKSQKSKMLSTAPQNPTKQQSAGGGGNTGTPVTEEHHCDASPPLHP